MIKKTIIILQLIEKTLSLAFCYFYIRFNFFKYFVRGSLECSIISVFIVIFALKTRRFRI